MSLVKDIRARWPGMSRKEMAETIRAVKSNPDADWREAALGPVVDVSHKPLYAPDDTVAEDVADDDEDGTVAVEANTVTGAGADVDTDGAPEPVACDGAGQDDELERALMGVGIVGDQLTDAIEAVRPVVQQLARQGAIRQAGSLLREWCDRLRGSPYAVALRVLIAGRQGKTVRELGREAGCGHAGFLRHLKSAKEALCIEKSIAAQRHTYIVGTVSAKGEDEYH